MKAPRNYTCLDPELQLKTLHLRGASDRAVFRDLLREKRVRQSRWLSLCLIMKPGRSMFRLQAALARKGSGFSSLGFTALGLRVFRA